MRTSSKGPANGEPKHRALLEEGVGRAEGSDSIEKSRFVGKERTVRQTTESIEAFESDIAAGVLRVLPVPASAWTVAQRVSRTHSARLGTRSLDILQVAIAIVLRADTFLTFDRNQAALAQAEGLTCEIRES